MVFRICSQCGAHLDPCERCDCLDKKETAPVLQHQDGWVEIGLPTNISTSNNKAKQGGLQG